MILNFLTSRFMSYLHIAEKNSIAKEVAQILSGGNKRTGHTLSKYNPVYLFDRDGDEHTFSSVRGHLFQYQLPPQCKSWYVFDNKKILTRQVPMVRKAGQDMDVLVKNLEQLGRGKKQLVLWLDCDRQGEAIAFQVIEVIKRVNPRINIKRARFAAVTPTDVHNAYTNLVNPNQLEADAVNYRIQIDFRMGCAFTRYQTTTFGKRFRGRDNIVLSYGPCQMPTLGFVVERYLEIKFFKPQKYWTVDAKIILTETSQVELRCERGTIKDEVEANIIFVNMYRNATTGQGVIRGKVMNRNKNPKKKNRPFPLTTVTFQKLATDKLRISSAEAMKIAEKLYTSGYISYPRTETNAFPSTMNIPNLVKRLQNCNPYSDYVTGLVNGKYMKPKVGNQNDQAHSPIHPVKPVDKVSLTQQQWRVYDLICRHFLACCSKDAVGIESELIADIGGETFKASHLTIKQKNYLQIYPFEKWIESDFPGEVPDQFQATVKLKEKKTQPPSYLTQSDLITLMQKNQIGTDSTIHEHIQTIQNRKYAVKTNNMFKPTNLGASLIVTYKGLGLKLEDCHIRRLIEERMNKIAQGGLSRQQAAKLTLSQVTPIYENLKNVQQRWLDLMGKALQDHQDLKQIDLLGQNERPARRVDNPINQNTQNTQNYSSRQDNQFSNNTGIVCYGCKKPGHILPNCPQKGKKVQTKTYTRAQTAQTQADINQNERKKLFCYSCKEPGHTVANCPEKNKKYTENKKYQGQKMKQKKFTCFTCGKQGHFAPDCPSRKPKQQNQYSNVTAKSCYLCKSPDHFANKCPKKDKKIKQ